MTEFKPDETTGSLSGLLQVNFADIAAPLN